MIDFVRENLAMLMRCRVLLAVVKDVHESDDGYSKDGSHLVFEVFDQLVNFLLVLELFFTTLLSWDFVPSRDPKIKDERYEDDEYDGKEEDDGCEIAGGPSGGILLLVCCKADGFVRSRCHRKFAGLPSVVKDDFFVSNEKKRKMNCTQLVL